MTARSFDLFVAGGGVIGLSIAYLSAKHQMAVALADVSAIGRESSWAGAGIFPPPPTQNISDPIDRLRAISHPMHVEWAAELLERTGVDNGFRRCGAIYLAGTPGEAATLGASQTWWNEHGIECERLTRNQLLDFEPNVESNHLHGQSAWYLPAECQVRNPRHLKALRMACEKMGVRFFEQAKIERLEQIGEELVSVRVDGRKISAKNFCFAVGAWSKDLLSPLGARLEIYPVRGQMVLYQTEPKLISRVINEGNRYLVPREDGRLLVGSSEEEVGFQKQTTPDVIDGLLQWANHWVPRLKSASVEQSWSGLRPGSLDGLPYIGRIPSAGNAFVASGHFRHGLHLSTGTARLICDMIRGERLPMNAEAFRIVRGKTSN